MKEQSKLHINEEEKKQELQTIDINVAEAAIEALPCTQSRRLNPEGDEEGSNKHAKVMGQAKLISN